MMLRHSYLLLVCALVLQALFVQCPVLFDLGLQASRQVDAAAVLRWQFDVGSTRASEIDSITVSWHWQVSNHEQAEKQL